MRQRVNWWKILMELNDSDLNDRFFSLLRTLRKGKTMSQNRCAYYVLKSYYSTTTIDELVYRCKQNELL